MILNSNLKNRLKYTNTVVVENKTFTVTLIDNTGFILILYTVMSGPSYTGMKYIVGTNHSMILESGGSYFPSFTMSPPTYTFTPRFTGRLTFIYNDYVAIIY